MESIDCLNKMEEEENIASKLHFEEDEMDEDEGTQNGTINGRTHWPCFLCPRQVSSWRALKHHLARIHFQDKFMTLSCSSMTQCGICHEKFTPGLSESSRKENHISYHLAFSHGLLEQLIPEAIKAIKLGQKPQQSKGLLRIKAEIWQSINQERQLKRSAEHSQRDFTRLNLKAKEAIFSSGVPRKHQCFLCPRNFRTPAALRYHVSFEHFLDELLQESGSSLDQCGLCEKQFKTETFVSGKGAALSFHLAYKHDLLRRLIIKRMSAMGKNPQAFIKSLQPIHLRSLVNQDMRPNNANLNISCLLCNGRFTKMTAVRYHLINTHLRKDILDVSGSSEDKCGMCGKQFGGQGKEKAAGGPTIIWHLAFQHGLLGKILPKDLSTLTTTGPRRVPSMNSMGRNKKIGSLNLSSAEMPCFLCPSNSKKYRFLVYHLAQHHYKDKLLSLTGSSADMCGICRKRFTHDRRQIHKESTICMHLALTHGLLKKMIPPSFRAALFPEAKPK